MVELSVEEDGILSCNVMEFEKAQCIEGIFRLNVQDLKGSQELKQASLYLPLLAFCLSRSSNLNMERTTI
jgi:hypothetical protein